MQKADSNSSDGTAADREQKVEDTNVSQHSRKPDVVGSQSTSNVSNPNTGKPTKKSVFDMVEETCNKNENGSYDVSNFDFNKAYKELGFTKVI